jgi:hypothetical protein
MGNADRVTELMQVLGSDEEPVRLNAAIELAHQGETAAIPVLVAALGHESSVLFQSALNRGPGSLIDYPCPYPKYEFFCYLVDRKNLMVHGSSHPDIDLLKPIRWSTDSSTHGNQNAVYADPDGIRPIYFGIIDRARVRNLHNGYFAAEDRAGITRRFYQFAIDAESLRRLPWREAMIYLLPRDSFEDVGEWVSRSPVQPLAKLSVVPEDFPFLREIRGADYSWRLSWSAEEGFLFLEEAERFPIRPKCR